MDVPSTIEGVIRDIAVSIGDKVSEGELIARLDATAAPPAGVSESHPGAPREDSDAPSEAVSVTPAAAKERSPGQRPNIDESTFAQAHAGPSVRRFARELGVDLGRVRGTGRKGRITGDDVKEFVKAVIAGEGDGKLAPVVSALPEVPEVDFSRFGEIEVQPLSRIQKISGPRLHASWVNLPHVTQFDEADTTALEARRQKLKDKAAKQGARLTPLAFLVVACVHALKEFPRFNSSLDPAGENLVFKKYFHIGFAADTPNGLVVPVIRDADKKTLLEIARDLATLSGKARDGKLGPTDMQGGCFTISSLGSIGGTAFTPIINAPEVAILGVSRSSMRPVWKGEAFEPRLMLPVSLSYDHRVIDGAEAVRFTRFLAEQLEDPDGLMLA
jgi:pyruvate dehydrogenase E2 component (dihydrolipoamide acetyltransferase)